MTMKVGSTDSGRATARGPTVAQEEPYHDQGQHSTFQQGAHSRIVLGLCKGYGVVDFGDPHVGILPAQLGHRGADAVCQRDFAGAFRLLDLKADDPPAFTQGDAAALRDRVPDRRDVPEAKRRLTRDLG
jgi:hypothetical protein